MSWRWTLIYLGDDDINSLKELLDNMASLKSAGLKGGQKICHNLGNEKKIMCQESQFLLSQDLMKIELLLFEHSRGTERGQQLQGL